MHCPRCDRDFEYDLIPGMSVTAVRLGTSRYMRCPLCHRFATFRLSYRTKQGGSEVGERPADATTTTGESKGVSLRRPLPRFNDRRTLARWIGVLVAPAVVLALVAAFVPLSIGAASVVLAASGVFLAAATILMIGFLLPERVL